MPRAKDKSGAEVIPLYRPRKCPICGKPAVQASRPFCSERCRKIDLDRWRTEAYRVQSEEAPDPDAPAPQDQEGEP